MRQHLVLAGLLAVVPHLTAAEPRHDRSGDPLPDRAVLRLGTPRLWHDPGVSRLAFSPDGKLLATAGNISRTGQELTIQLWEVPGGRRRARWAAEQGRDLLALAFAPDGKTLASAGWQNGVSLWSVPDGKEVRRLKNQNGPPDGGVTSLAFAPDGKALAVGEMGGGVTLWDLAGDRPPRRYKLHDRQAQFLTFSPDGKKLAAAVAQHGTCVVDVASGAGLCRMPPAAFFAFTADGKQLALWGQHDGLSAILLCDAASGARRGKPREMSCQVQVLARTSAGKLIAAGVAAGQEDGPAELWDVVSGEKIVSLRGAFKRAVAEMALSAEGKLLAVADGPTLRLWDATTGREYRAERGHGRAVCFVGLAADDRTLVTAADPSDVTDDDGVRLWDAATGAPRRLGRGRVLSVHLSADRNSLTWVNHTADDVLHLHLWDLLADKEIGRAQAEQGLHFSSLAFAPDGQTLAWGAYQEQPSLFLWDVRGGRLTRRFGGDWPPDALAFAPDGKMLAVAAFRSLELWDPAAGKRLRRLSDEEDANQLTFSADGKFLASWKPGLPILVWDVERGALVRRLGGRKYFPRALRLFSPDGRYLLLAGRGNTLHLYDVRSGDEFRRFPGPRHFELVRRGYWDDRFYGPLSDVAFSADGKTLAAEQKDGSIRLWEVATGAERRHLSGHEGGVRSLAFLPGDRRLVSGGEDTTALVWDVTGLGGEAREEEPSARELDRLWAGLAGEAGPAYRALWRLALSPRRSVPYLAERLRPVVAPEPARIRRLIADLDSDTFARREAARKELLELAELAAAPLRAALADKPALETRRRLEELIDRLDEALPPPGQVRVLRAIEALEHAGTAEARRLLQSLAEGTPAARVTQEARAALRRLEASGRR